MAKFIDKEYAHTGDKCFHCGQSEYWWKVQIQSTKPDGIVNTCVCGECVLLSADELLTPILRKE
jgi:hypothetical protein